MFWFCPFIMRSIRLMKMIILTDITDREVTDDEKDW